MSAATQPAETSPAVRAQVRFTDLLQRLLDSKGRPFWLESDFAPYGTADDFTLPG